MGMHDRTAELTNADVAANVRRAICSALRALAWSAVIMGLALLVVSLGIWVESDRPGQQDRPGRWTALSVAFFAIAWVLGATSAQVRDDY